MSRRRPTIADLMKWVLVIALVLGVLRDPYRWGFYLNAWLIFGLLLIALHYFWFVYAPPKLVKRLARGDKARERKLLEWIVMTPSLLGERQKVLARYLLIIRYQHDRLYQSAADQAEILLSIKLRPGLESATRLRLADALEALGRTSEADDERQRAAASLRKPADYALEHMTRGKLLKRGNKHAEAYREFELGLNMTSPSHPNVQNEFMLQLMLSAFDAGRPADCARWAEQVIANHPKKGSLLSAHRMAGVAYGNIGKLEDAERHKRRAYELATETGEPHQVARCLAQLADVQRMRGNLAEAKRGCLDAASMSPAETRQANAVLSSVLRLEGRFEESLEALH